MRRASMSILLLFLAAPAHAQLSDAPTAHAKPHIVVTPAESDPWEMRDEPPLDVNLASELFPNGGPNLLAPDSIAQKYKLPAIVPDPNAKQAMPTGINYTDGPLKYDLGTKVTTATTTTTVVPPALPDRNKLGGATGGTGEVKGSITYVGEHWELYGRQSVGVGHTDGVGASVSETTTVGSFYKLPDSAVNGKIGASIEMNAANERKSRIEYRQNFGPAEGFIAAEQTFKPAATDIAPPAVRTGVSRKF
jgi:hypothetical protein